MPDDDPIKIKEFWWKVQSGFKNRKRNKNHVEKDTRKAIKVEKGANFYACCSLIDRQKTE